MKVRLMLCPSFDEFCFVRPLETPGFVRSTLAPPWSHYW